jgi:hypothetical protein
MGPFRRNIIKLEILPLLRNTKMCLRHEYIFVLIVLEYYLRVTKIGIQGNVNHFC